MQFAWRFILLLHEDVKVWIVLELLSKLLLAV